MAMIGIYHAAHTEQAEMYPKTVCGAEHKAKYNDKKAVPTKETALKMRKRLTGIKCTELTAQY